MAVKEFQKTRIIGRKRVLVPNKIENSSLSSPFSTPSPKRRVAAAAQLECSNGLESLPQDLLVRILCNVGHEDLKQLLLVCKFVNEATLIAKESHFMYCTPRTKPVFREVDDDNNELGDSVRAPDAPKQRRFARSRMMFEKIASVAVALFPDDDDKPMDK